MSRLFFVAGESSGDTHGANLIRALRQRDPEITSSGIGGKQMEAAGMKLHFDLASRAIMGFVEVIKSLGFIRKLFKSTMNHIREDQPDAVVLIDYPGFNLRLAKEIQELGIPIIWYISPQVWAWKKGRIHTLARRVDKMLVILPFEKELYDKVGLDCAYVGHPLLDHIDAVKTKDTFAGDCTIGLMPGSRAQEIERIFPVMLDVGRAIREHHPEARFVTPVVDEERAEQIKELAGDFSLEIAQDQFYDILSQARFCLVASGTATVETALFNVPMIVLYKVNALTYWLARLLVNIDAIALVNILAGRHIVPEFIQNEAVPADITTEALELIADSDRREQMLQDLREIRETLGGTGASDRAAEEIISVLNKNSNG